MKTPEILEHLRARIVRGEFKPGDKLPNRPELLKEYSVCISAFQKCINQLVAENFIESRGAKGMCVTANPPHLCRFAVLLPGSEQDSGVEQDSFSAGLRLVVAEYTRQHPECSFLFYHLGSMSDPAIDRWSEFAADASRGLLAGAVCVFLSPPAPVRKQLGDFPCVVISKLRSDAPHRAPDISFDMQKLLQLELAHLAEKGCRKAAVLMFDNMTVAHNMEIMDAAENGPLYCPRKWILGMNLTSRDLLYYNMFELLFSPQNTEVPDGLAVLNENFLPIILNALTRLNLVPGRDVRIVSHGNRPNPRKLIPEVDYIPFDVGEVLQQALSLLRNWDSLPDKEIDISMFPRKEKE